MPEGVEVSSARDEGDVIPCGCKAATEVSTDATGSDYGDLHGAPFRGVGGRCCVGRRA